MKNYQRYTDAELVDLLRQDDNEAFIEIYERYHALLLTYAYRKLQDEQGVKDIIQEVFLTLWEKRVDFTLKTYLSGYLYKSVLNKVLNIWKHNKIVREHAETHKLSIDIDTYETDFLIREKEIAAMILQQIEAMPPRMREVYQLKHQQFLSTKQIAANLGISEHTVSNQLQSASAHLKKKLGILIYIIYLLNK